MKKMRKPRILRTLTAFPTVMYFKLKYDWIIWVSTSLQTPQSYVYRASSIYDPDLSGTGHQPFYFDQLAAIYQYFSVTDSTISIQVVPGTLQAPLFVGVVPYTQSSLNINDYTEMMELKGVRYRIVNQDSTGTNSIYKKQTTHKIIGVKKSEVLSNVNYICTPSNDSWRLVYWHLKYGPLDYNPYNGATVYMLNVRIIYTVKCFNLLDISQS